MSGIQLLIHRCKNVHKFVSVQMLILALIAAEYQLHCLPIRLYNARFKIEVEFRIVIFIPPAKICDCLWFL